MDSMGLIQDCPKTLLLYHISICWYQAVDGVSNEYEATIEFEQGKPCDEQFSKQMLLTM